jgi:hypothetical protein
MSNLTTFSSANLPSVQALSTALRAIESQMGAPSGVVIIKMDKTGHWVFGADSTEIENDSTWAINPFSFIHGYIAWGVGEVLGEKMVSITQPLPELDAAPAGAPKGWETQVGMSMKCLSGEDKDMEVRFTTTSIGGKRAVQGFAVILANQVDKDPTKPVAVIKLSKDHYMNPQYGKIFFPVFDIQSWVGMDADKAEQLEAPKEAETVAETSAPATRRRRS